MREREWGVRSAEWGEGMGSAEWGEGMGSAEWEEGSGKFGYYQAWVQPGLLNLPLNFATGERGQVPLPNLH
jgi:hypothetical protein